MNQRCTCAWDAGHISNCLTCLLMRTISNEQNSMIPPEQSNEINEGMQPTEHQVSDITGIYKTERPLVDPQKVFNTPIYMLGEQTTEFVPLKDYREKSK